MAVLPTPENPIVLVEPVPEVDIIEFEPETIEVVTAAAFLPVQDVARTPRKRTPKARAVQATI